MIRMARYFPRRRVDVVGDPEMAALTVDELRRLSAAPPPAVGFETDWVTEQLLAQHLDRIKRERVNGIAV